MTGSVVEHRNSHVGPLEGIRIADFGWWSIGAIATRTLAAFGAEVVKIESPRRPDITRVVPPFPDHLATLEDRADEGDLNRSGLFAKQNANKLSLSVDMRHPRGREIVRRLISVSDIVSENFRPGVMEDWGLGYQQLQELKSDIIFARYSGRGHSGPEARYGSGEPVAQGLSGVSSLTGVPGREPCGWGFSFVDYAAAYYGTMAILLALRCRDLTGEGQEIDIAAVEAGVNLLGPDLLDFTANGRPYRREGMPPGNRLTGRPVAPHGVYPTNEEDRWIAIAVFDDAEWEGLVQVMGHPAWAAQPRFKNLHERVRHQDELNGLIEGWTRGQERYFLMERLQEAGIRAGVVQTAEDVNERDPQIRLRRLFPETDHPILGKRPVEGLPYRMSASPVAARWRAGPCLGEHTMYVLTEVLGMASREVGDLVEEGVVG